MREPTDLRDAGMALALDHADSVAVEWSVQAWEWLLELSSVLGRFTAPQIRAAAYAGGLSRPPSERAWGKLFARARRDGLIEEHSFVESSREMHQQPIRMWERT